MSRMCFPTLFIVISHPEQYICILSRKTNFHILIFSRLDAPFAWPELYVNIEKKGIGLSSYGQSNIICITLAGNELGHGICLQGKITPRAVEGDGPTGRSFLIPLCVLSQDLQKEFCNFVCCHIFASKTLQHCDGNCTIQCQDPTSYNRDKNLTWTES